VPAAHGTHCWRGRRLALHAARVPGGAARQRQRRAATGWTPHFVTLWRGDELQAACPLYFKDHSYGEYVFDWAWANAYEQHGLRYYPKALAAVPFTPVPGPRLLARDAAAAAPWSTKC
jgi:predicted N-acyltransferase